LIFTFYSIFLIIYFSPQRVINLLPVPSYLFSLIFLVAVLFIGRRVYGSKSWMDFGSIGFQPSEFAKIGLIFLLSYFLSRDKTNIESFKDILIALVISTIPILLILLEPDVGTTFVFVVIVLMLLFWKGISLFKLFIVLSPPVVVLAYMFGTVSFIIALLLVALALFYFKKNLFLITIRLRIKLWQVKKYKIWKMENYKELCEKSGIFSLQDAIWFAISSSTGFRLSPE